MRLKQVTMFVIVGITCSFLVRAVGTCFQSIFQNIRIAQLTVFIHVLAGLALLCFYISFFRQYIPRDQQVLKRATLLAILGTAMVLFLHIKGLFLAFDVQFFPLVLTSPYVDSTIPLVSTIAVLVFFLVFHREIRRNKSSGLNGAVLLAMIGTLIRASLQMFVLIAFLYSGQFRWLEHFSRKIAVGSVIIFSASFLALLYFFVVFYRTFDEPIVDVRSDVYKTH